MLFKIMTYKFIRDMFIRNLTITMNTHELRDVCLRPSLFVLSRQIDDAVFILS